MIYNGTTITITLTSNVNVHQPDVAEIYYKKPSGQTGYWTATVQGNHNLVYSTSVGDVDIPGVWVLQGKVIKNGSTYWTSLVQMIVEQHI